jgi:hypothetical protein
VAANPGVPLPFGVSDAAAGDPPASRVRVVAAVPPAVPDPSVGVGHASGEAEVDVELPAGDVVVPFVDEDVGDVVEVVAFVDGDVVFVGLEELVDAEVVEVGDVAFVVGDAGLVVAFDVPAGPEVAFEDVVTVGEGQLVKDEDEAVVLDRVGDVPVEFVALPVGLVDSEELSVPVDVVTLLEVVPVELAEPVALAVAFDVPFAWDEPPGSPIAFIEEPLDPPTMKWMLRARDSSPLSPQTDSFTPTRSPALKACFWLGMTTSMGTGVLGLQTMEAEEAWAEPKETPFFWNSPRTVARVETERRIVVESQPSRRFNVTLPETVVGAVRLNSKLVAQDVTSSVRPM